MVNYKIRYRKTEDIWYQEDPLITDDYDGILNKFRYRVRQNNYRVQLMKITYDGDGNFLSNDTMISFDVEEVEYSMNTAIEQLGKL